MSASFASVDVPIETRPTARFYAGTAKTVIQFGTVQVFIGSVDEVHSLIDELQDVVREMARAESDKAASEGWG